VALAATCHFGSFYSFTEGQRGTGGLSIYLHLTRKRLEQLHAPFDLLRLPRREELDGPQG
jgi:hypothetical protein